MRNLPQPTRNELNHRGFALVDIGTSDSALLSLARCLGVPVPSRLGIPIIRELSPTKCSSAKVETFSSVFGLKDFPLHTDTAHWPVPARFVILRDVGTSHDRPTLVAESRRLLDGVTSGIAIGSIWKVIGPRGVFLCSTISCSLGQEMLRFDPLCMRPMNGAARQILEILDRNKIGGSVIHWKQGITLIIDNWRAVHGRGACAADDSRTRCLQRVLVFDKKFLPLFPYVLAA